MKAAPQRAEATPIAHEPAKETAREAHPLEAAWTTRGRIIARARAAQPEPEPQPAKPEPEPQPAKPEPEPQPAEPEPEPEPVVAAPTVQAAPVAVREEAEPEVPEPVEELEEDAPLLARVADVLKRRAGLRATLDAGGEDVADKSRQRGDGELQRVGVATIAPTDGVAHDDAPGQSVEPRARGPPRVVQRKLEVSVPGDPLEREADEAAARVLGGAGTSTTKTAAPTPTEVPEEVEYALDTTAGTSLDTTLRERIEPHVDADLSHVRVRDDAQANAAAKAIHAKAFTSGRTIYLSAAASRHDAGLMAHESAHVAQQNPRTRLMRDISDYLPDVSVSDLIPDWILDGVRSAVRAIPGYTLLTYITGTDPLTHEAVTVSHEQLIETLLTFGPFGQAVATVLQSIDVLDEVFTFVSQGLQAHNLTLARLEHDVDAAWHEFSAGNLIAGNVAIVRRYVDALLADVRAFIADIVDRIIQMVRDVVADVAEPLLETPEIAPVWNLTKKVLHHDPLKGTAVQATTAEIIADFLRLIGQEQRLAQMQERGTLQQTADWLDTQLATFSGLLTELGTLFSDAWNAIQPQNLPNLLDNLHALAQRVFGFITRVGDFASTVIGKILEIIKDALLAWLSENAHRVPGFHLLTVILGRNPFTGEDVPRTAENLIKGFITLLPNGEQTYDQLAQSGVIADAAGRIEGAMARLGISWAMVTGLFHSIWDSVSLDDLLRPIEAFTRIIDLFGEPLGRLLEFVAEVVQVVVELILRLMNFPSDLLASIIAHTVQAIEDIKRDPVAFLKNLLAALKLGLSNFFDHILGYLLQGLGSWLFRGLGQLGITIPPDFSVQSIITLVLQVLGLTAEHLWQKLGEHIGQDRVAMIRGALDRLSGAWEFIKDVQEHGISAVWRYIQQQLSNLWDTLLGMARDWVIRTVVNRVVARLLTLLDPTGIAAVINGFIAFFNAVQSAIEYLRDILQIVDRYVSTLAAVAAGNIVPGAQMLEQGLAAAIPVAIGFLANQVGLGNVPEQIVAIIGRLRELVDQAIDWLLDQAIRLGQAALNALGVGQGDTSPEGRKQAALTEIRAAMTRGIRRSELVALLADVRRRFELRRCELVGEADVIVENSPEETVHGVLSFSQAEITAATGVSSRLPGRGGGRDYVVGAFDTTGETLPTIRGLLEPYRADWATWEAGEGVRVSWPQGIANLDAQALRPASMHVTLTGVLQIRVRDVPRTAGFTGKVGDMGDVEHAIREHNVDSHKIFVGGHVVAHQFGGPETYANLVPMRGTLNDPIYAGVEDYVRDNITALRPQTQIAPEERGVSAELDFTMTYPGDVRAPIWQLADMVSTEIGPGVRLDRLSATERTAALARMEESRQTLRASILSSASGSLTIPARIPTAITMRARFTDPGGPSTPAPGNVSAANVSRTLDPVIIVPGAAPTPATPSTPPATPAAAPPTGPWEHSWTFTQGL